MIGGEAEVSGRSRRGATQREGQTLVEARGDTDVHIVRNAWRKNQNEGEAND